MILPRWLIASTLLNTVINSWSVIDLSAALSTIDSLLFGKLPPLAFQNTILTPLRTSSSHTALNPSLCQQLYIYISSIVLSFKLHFAFLTAYLLFHLIDISNLQSPKINWFPFKTCATHTNFPFAVNGNYNLPIPWAKSLGVHLDWSLFLSQPILTPPSGNLGSTFWISTSIVIPWFYSQSSISLVDSWAM